MLRVELPWVVQRRLSGVSRFNMPQLEGPDNGQLLPRPVVQTNEENSF